MPPLHSCMHVRMQHGACTCRGEPLAPAAAATAAGRMSRAMEVMEEGCGRPWIPWRRPRSTCSGHNGTHTGGGNEAAYPVPTLGRVGGSNIHRLHAYTS